MLVGNMQISSDNNRPSTELQRDVLISVGVDPRRLFKDKANGARNDWVRLKQALDDILAVDR